MELSEFKDEILDILKEKNFYQSIKKDEERLVKIITEDSQEYFTFLRMSSKKTPISAETYSRCVDVVDSLKNVTASLETYYGKVSNGWKIENKRIEMRTLIPVNTTAIIYFPSSQHVMVNGKNDPAQAGLKLIRTENGYMIFEAGSGSYQFGDR